MIAPRWHAAGLFFRPQSRAHIGMDQDLQHVIHQAPVDAQAVGKDYFTQTELAVRAVLQVRPDMTASDRRDYAVALRVHRVG